MNLRFPMDSVLRLLADFPQTGIVTKEDSIIPDYGHTGRERDLGEPPEPALWLVIPDYRSGASGLPHLQGNYLDSRNPSKVAKAYPVLKPETKAGLIKFLQAYSGAGSVIPIPLRMLREGFIEELLTEKGLDKTTKDSWFVLSFGEADVSVYIDPPTIPESS